jgi:hypothetical protein
MARLSVSWITFPVLVSLTASIIVFVKLSLLINGHDGDLCWDKNRNYECDIRLEDVNRDGECNYDDCYGVVGINGNDGKNGSKCWDINENGDCDLELEDVNNDGNCTLDDCYEIINGTQCFDDITPTYSNTTDCKGEDLVLNTTTPQYCYDLNGNGLGDLLDEDTNNDTIVNVTDCNGIVGRKCWDDNDDGICQGGEAYDGFPCTVTDCIGSRGESGTGCWDTDQDHFCDFAESQGPGIPCTSNDCYGYQCWDLNQNKVCNLASEDFNGDGTCDRDDCYFEMPVSATYESLPNRTLERYGPDSEATTIAAYNITARVAQFIIDFIHLPNITYFNNLISVRNVYDNLAFDQGFSMSAEGNYTVIVDDDLEILFSLYLAGGFLSPRNTSDLTIYADIVFSQSNTSISVIDPVGSTLTVTTGDYFFGSSQNIRTNNITSNISITFSAPTTRIEGDFTFSSVSRRVLVNDISANDGYDYVRVNVDGAIDIPIDTYDLASNYMRLDTISSYKHVEGEPLTTLNIWSVQTAILGSPIGNGILAMNGDIISTSGSNPVEMNPIVTTTTTTISANSSDLTLVANTTGYINVAPTNEVHTDYFTSKSGDLNLIYVTIGDLLETDYIAELTTGLSTTSTNGIKLQSSLASYSAYKLDFYELYDFTTTLYGIYAAPLPVPIEIERIGVKVTLSVTATTRFTSIISSQIYVTDLIPDRFKPSIDYIYHMIPVYDNNVLEYAGLVEIFANGTIIISADYHAGASRRFTAAAHQNGVASFSLEYLI